MRKKKQPGSAAWSDPDDAPELTAEMPADAEIFEGDQFVRRGHPHQNYATEKQFSSKGLILVRNS